MPPEILNVHTLEHSPPSLGVHLHDGLAFVGEHMGQVIALTVPAATVLRLRELLARSAEEKPASVDLGLLESMVAGLDGMTTSAWPDRVFELGAAVEEVPVS